MDPRGAGGGDGLDGIATLESCETQFQVFEVHQARERGATDFVDEMAKFFACSREVEGSRRERGSGRDCDLVRGVTEGISYSIVWARNFWNMSDRKTGQG